VQWDAPDRAGVTADTEASRAGHAAVAAFLRQRIQAARAAAASAPAQMQPAGGAGAAAGFGSGGTAGGVPGGFAMRFGRAPSAVGGPRPAVRTGSGSLQVRLLSGLAPRRPPPLAGAGSSPLSESAGSEEGGGDGGDGSGSGEA
jgi:hypothetical protein